MRPSSERPEGQEAPAAPRRPLLAHKVALAYVGVYWGWLALQRLAFHAPVLDSPLDWRRAGNMTLWLVFLGLAMPDLLTRLVRWVVPPRA